MKKVLLVAFLLVLSSGCAAPSGTKREAFPEMYGEQKPISILVLPTINESTATDAGDLLFPDDLLDVTASRMFSDRGYYVIPVPLVAELMRRDGIGVGAQLKRLPTRIFKEKYGADSVLFVTVEDWDETNLVVAGHVSVAVEYVLVSTTTNDLIWSHNFTYKLFTGGSSQALLDGGMEYVSSAELIHLAGTHSLPFGKYHPRSGHDGADPAVNKTGTQGLDNRADGN